jgi:hypothetical protein
LVAGWWTIATMILETKREARRWPGTTGDAVRANLSALVTLGFSEKLLERLSRVDTSKAAVKTEGTQ